MKKSTKWVYMLVGGFLAVGLIAGAGYLYITSEAAQRYSPLNKSAYVSLGWLTDGDRPQGKYVETLAEALGISVEQLQEALDAVWQANIEAAVEAGKLSQEQADRMLERQGDGFRRRMGPIGIGVDGLAQLASELGITVDELEAAQAQAHESLMAEAIANGDLTEEHAELMQAHHALSPYLQAAIAEAFETAVAEALGDGAITQAQADLLLEGDGPPMRGGGFSPGGPRMQGHGGGSPGGRFSKPDKN